MRVALLQSNYLPWKGYFDLIGKVDLFIFHDDLQYTKGDWRNRNRIKTRKGKTWITVPCGISEKRLIVDVTLDSPEWQKRHRNMIHEHYRMARYYDEYTDLLESIYEKHEWKYLSEMNQTIIQSIARDILGFKTEFEDSRTFRLKKTKGARVLELLERVGAQTYVSGPSAKSYLREEEFNDLGIQIEWMDYNGYSEYPQLHPPFEHDVSILDLILNTGPKARGYMHS